MIGNIKNKPYSFRALLPWFLIIVGLFMLAATLYFAATKPPKLASRADVLSLQAIVTDIKTNLEDTNGAWQNTSSCTIVEPRKFGEETRYYCRVEYAREYKFIGSQEDMRRTIDKQHEKIASHFGVGESKSPSYPSYDITTDSKVSITDRIGSYVFFIKGTPKANCAVNNVIKPSGEAVILKQNVGCTINTVGAFGQNIRRV